MVQAQKPVRKQQSAVLHRPPMDHMEATPCHQVTPRPEAGDPHLLKRFGQENNLSVSSMIRYSLGTLARMLNGFKDRKLLQRLEGSLNLFNPLQNLFSC